MTTKDPLLWRIEEMIETQEHLLKRYGNIEAIAAPADKVLQALDIVKALIQADRERIIKELEKNCSARVELAGVQHHMLTIDQAIRVVKGENEPTGDGVYNDMVNIKNKEGE